MQEVTFEQAVANLRDTSPLNSLSEFHAFVDQADSAALNQTTTEGHTLAGIAATRGLSPTVITLCYLNNIVPTVADQALVFDAMSKDNDTDIAAAAGLIVRAYEEARRVMVMDDEALYAKALKEARPLTTVFSIEAAGLCVRHDISPLKAFLADKARGFAEWLGTKATRTAYYPPLQNIDAAFERLQGIRKVACARGMFPPGGIYYDMAQQPV